MIKFKAVFLAELLGEIVVELLLRRGIPDRSKYQFRLLLRQSDVTLFPDDIRNCPDRVFIISFLVLLVLTAGLLLGFLILASLGIVLPVSFLVLASLGIVLPVSLLVLTPLTAVIPFGFLILPVLGVILSFGFLILLALAAVSCLLPVLSAASGTSAGPSFRVSGIGSLSGSRTVFNEDLRFFLSQIRTESGHWHGGCKIILRRSIDYKIGSRKLFRKAVFRESSEPFFFFGRSNSCAAFSGNEIRFFFSRS